MLKYILSGNELAENEVAPTTINLLSETTDTTKTNSNLFDISDNGFAPDSIQLKISNFISGDVIKIKTEDLPEEIEAVIKTDYNPETGVLTITNNYQVKTMMKK